MKSIVFCAARPLGPTALDPVADRPAHVPTRPGRPSVGGGAARRSRSAAGREAGAYNPESLAVSYLSTGRIKDGVRVIG